MKNYKINEIFLNINNIVDTRINLIAIILSEEKLLISDYNKVTTTIIEYQICDNTGKINLININDKLEIGKEYILINIKVNILNNKIYLIYDNISEKYENKMENIGNIKINKLINYNNINLKIN